MIILKWIWKKYAAEVRTNATGCGLGTMEALVNSAIKHHIPQKTLIYGFTLFILQTSPIFSFSVIWTYFKAKVCRQ
jgi:hypothetical protein